MSNRRVYAVTTEDGYTVELFSNRQSAQAYVAARDPLLLHVVPWDVQSEFIMPAHMWSVLIDECGNELRTYEYVDWDNDYRWRKGGSAFYTGPRTREWRAWGCSLKGPEDALRVAREAMQKTKEQRERRRQANAKKR